MNKTTKFTAVSRTAAATALLLLAFGSASAQKAAPAAAPAAASAPQEAARPEVAKLLTAAQDLSKEGKHAEALAKLKEAEALGNLSPYESFFVQRIRAGAALGANDVPLTIQSLNAVAAAGRLQGEDLQRVLLALADLHFRQKDYPQTIAAAQRYHAEGGKDPAVTVLMTNAMYLQGDFAGAAKALEAEVQADEAAGRPITEQRLRMLASSQIKIKDEAGYGRTVERLVTRYPKPELWVDLINRVQSEPGFNDQQLRLDAYRLRMATGTMSQAGHYAEAAQLALQAGYPAEAVKILDEGYARGLLGTGGQAARHNELRAQARKVAAADAATLAQASPQTAKNADVMATMGWALFSAGHTDKGLAMLEQAVAKGGLKRADEAKLRLGVAQFQAGRKDAALQTFKTVQGKDGTADLARVWTLLAQAPSSTTAQAPAAGGTKQQ